MGHLSAYIVLSQKTSAISKKRILRMYFVRGCLLHGWIGLLVVNVRQWKDSYRRVSYKGGEQHTVSNYGEGDEEHGEGYEQLPSDANLRAPAQKIEAANTTSASPLMSANADRMLLLM